MIQPPDPNQNFFQLFDLPMRFPLERDLLQYSYQSLQKQFHPDHFVLRNATERRFSLEHVTRLNQAYQTLKDPLARSEYLLERLGYPLSEQDQQGVRDPDFLLEVMEDREALEAVDLTADQAVERLGRLRIQADERIAFEQAELVRLFEVCALSVASEVGQKIVQTNHRLRYHRRFLEALEQAEEKIDAEEGY